MARKKDRDVEPFTTWELLETAGREIKGALNRARKTKPGEGALARRRAKAVESQVNKAVGRMREGQSTDSNNR